jgi:hypothetical protein
MNEPGAIERLGSKHAVGPRPRPLFGAAEVHQHRGSGVHTTSLPDRLHGREKRHTGVPVGNTAERPDV